MKGNLYMKIIRKLSLPLILAAILITHPLSVIAEPMTSTQVTREYLEDGSYFETVIASSEDARSTIKNASKTTTYKNSSGESLWYAKVTANFYFDGSTSSCTSSSASGGSYVSTWRILDKSASRTGNTGSATVTAGAYYAGIFVDSYTKVVTISCDKNGNVY